MDAKVKNVWQEVNTHLMPQYGTGMHYPYCQQASCTGCLPPIREVEPEEEPFDLTIFWRKD